MKPEQFRKLLVKGIKELYATDSQLLDKDLDINERTGYPDIIIHTRKQPINLAIVEVKMKWKTSRKNFDCEKLDAYKMI